jgi:ElaB/YqjD/DUF883 family membrane-anchored ribosome-binding protein
METHFEGLQTDTENVSGAKIKEDLRVLVNDAEELVKATAGDMSEKAREARSKLAQALQSAKTTLQRQTTAAAKATDQAIRRHPYESIGVAFGIGLLIGVLVGRR